VKCSVCEEKLKKTDTYFGDKNTFYEGKPLCESCYYEDEPCTTVLYKGDDQPYVISHTRDETEGDFSVGWHSTDPWRGYYETKSEKYALVNTAELLAYHESEEMLKSFDDRIRELFDEHDIDYARVFARSSNVFYNNYDLFSARGMLYRHVDFAASMALSLATCASATLSAPPIRIPHQGFSFEILKCLAVGKVTKTIQ
jgi:hypothetical protein